MATTVQERVRKYRAKKMSTEKGHKELLATNRQYKRRNYRKKKIARLMERRSMIAAGLSKGAIGDVIANSRARRAQMLMEKFEGRDVKAMTVDERQELDLDTLNYEIKILKVKVDENPRNVCRSSMGASGDVAKVDLADGPPQSVTAPSHAALSAEGVSTLSTTLTPSSAGSSSNAAVGTSLTPTKTMSELIEAFEEGVLELGHAAKEVQSVRMRALVSASALLQLCLDIDA